MRASVALVSLALLAFCIPAQAKFAPVEAQVLASVPDDTTINSGASGTMLEASYFSAPQPFAAGRLAPCRLQVRMFDKTRLAFSCH
jgi:hypothetical protein